MKKKYKKQMKKSLEFKRFSEKMAINGMSNIKILIIILTVGLIKNTRCK